MRGGHVLDSGGGVDADFSDQVDVAGDDVGFADAVDSLYLVSQSVGVAGVGLDHDVGGDHAQAPPSALAGPLSPTTMLRTSERVSKSASTTRWSPASSVSSRSGVVSGASPFPWAMSLVLAGSSSSESE